MIRRIKQKSFQFLFEKLGVGDLLRGSHPTHATRMPNVSCFCVMSRPLNDDDDDYLEAVSIRQLVSANKHEIDPMAVSLMQKKIMRYFRGATAIFAEWYIYATDCIPRMLVASSYFYQTTFRITSTM